MKLAEEVLRLSRSVSTGCASRSPPRWRQKIGTAVSFEDLADGEQQEGVAGYDELGSMLAVRGEANLGLTPSERAFSSRKLTFDVSAPYVGLDDRGKGKIRIGRDERGRVRVKKTAVFAGSVGKRGDNHQAKQADDHGDATAATKVLSGSGSLSASGLIGRTGEVELFALTSGPGVLAVNVAPAERGANLDISLELLDTSGAVVASGNPADLLTAGLSVTVDQGDCYLSVRGTETVDPLADGHTNYASLGWRTL